MAQYHPHYKADGEEFYEEIGRSITEDEYEAVIDHAHDVGLERLYLDRSMLETRPGLLDRLTRR